MNISEAGFLKSQKAKLPQNLDQPKSLQERALDVLKHGRKFSFWLSTLVVLNIPQTLKAQEVNFSHDQEPHKAEAVQKAQTSRESKPPTLKERETQISKIVPSTWSRTSDGAAVSGSSETTYSIDYSSNSSINPTGSMLIPKTEQITIIPEENAIYSHTSNVEIGTGSTPIATEDIVTLQVSQNSDLITFGGQFYVQEQNEDGVLETRQILPSMKPAVLAENNTTNPQFNPDFKIDERGLPTDLDFHKDILDEVSVADVELLEDSATDQNAAKKLLQTTGLNFSVGLPTQSSQSGLKYTRVEPSFKALENETKAYTKYGKNEVQIERVSTSFGVQGSPATGEVSAQDIQAQIPTLISPLLPNPLSAKERLARLKEKSQTENPTLEVAPVGYIAANPQSSAQVNSALLVESTSLNHVGDDAMRGNMQAQGVVNAWESTETKITNDNDTYISTFYGVGTQVRPERNFENSSELLSDTLEFKSENVVSTGYISNSSGTNSAGNGVQAEIFGNFNKGTNLVGAVSGFATYNRTQTTRETYTERVEYHRVPAIYGGFQMVSGNKFKAFGLGVQNFDFINGTFATNIILAGEFKPNLNTSLFAQFRFDTASTEFNPTDIQLAANTTIKINKKVQILLNAQGQWMLSPNQENYSLGILLDTTGIDLGGKLIFGSEDNGYSFDAVIPIGKAVVTPFYSYINQEQIFGIGSQIPLSRSIELSGQIQQRNAPGLDSDTSFKIGVQSH
jgi:hypothetical protein